MVARSHARLFRSPTALGASRAACRNSSMASANAPRARKTVATLLWLLALPGSSRDASRKCASASAGPICRERMAEVVVRERVIWLQPQCLLISRDRVLPPAARRERRAEVVVRGRRVGLKLQHHLEVRGA